MRNNIIVQKLIGYITKIMNYCEGYTYNQFYDDSKLVEACVFNLSQMGELVNKLDKSFRMNHPEVPWNNIYGLRNRIVHDYEGVNFALIWEIIQDDLPDLYESLKKI